MQTHPHPHHQAASSRRILFVAVALTLGFAAIEFVAGWVSGSLALMADAGHMLTDASALGLAALAAWMARRPASKRRTWGYGRAEVVAALINGGAMIVLVGLIAWQALERFERPRDIEGIAVIAVAAIGLLVNLAVFVVLERGGDDLNVRGAVLHVLGDLLGSLAALVSGMVILVTGWTPIDPMLSLLICGLILFAAARLLRDAIHVVMEGVPGHIDLERVRAYMTGMTGVRDVHDLHIWQVSGQRVALSAHVVVEDLRQWPDILAALNAGLDEAFSIDHPTLQPEVGGQDRCELHPEACR
jgi:cobalt-zinc-cadmium efflux system protein